MRHARILEVLGCHVAIVSLRKTDHATTYEDLTVALSVEKPDYIVIANQTSQHHDTLSKLAELEYKGIVLVEKPLFSQSLNLPPLPFKKVYVGYNLRFHPVVQRLKSLIEGQVVLSVMAYAGQYLPNWRPDSDYKQSYSAHAKRGGGVIRDLSHELDYLIWLFGEWTKVNGVGGHFSSLEIDSDDVFSLMISTQLCPVLSLQMNYLDRVGRRFILINTDKHTIKADLVNGIVMVDGDSESFSTERDFTYQKMHDAILNYDGGDSCTLNEGQVVIHLIESAELSSKNLRWVEQ